MATKEEIKKAILEVSGNPDSGIVRDNVDTWAQAVWELDNEVKPAKEVRVVEAKETR
jgi:hypothetical protein